MNTNAKAPLARNVSTMGVRSFYARVCVLGFGLIGLVGVELILSLVTGTAGTDSVFVLVFALIGLLVAGLVWRFGRWHHFVDYSSFQRKNKLVLKSNVVIDDELPKGYEMRIKVMPNWKRGAKWK